MNKIKEFFKKVTNNYSKVITKTFTFKGRATRSEYWYFHLANLVVLLGLSSLQLTFTSLIYALFSALPSLSLAIRRLHDSGNHGSLVLLQFIPFLGPFLFLLLMLIKTQPFTNRYGKPDAKYLLSEKIYHDYDSEGNIIYDFKVYDIEKNDNHSQHIKNEIINKLAHLNDTPEKLPLLEELVDVEHLNKLSDNERKNLDLQHAQALNIMRDIAKEKYEVKKLQIIKDSLKQTHELSKNIDIHKDKVNSLAYEESYFFFEEFEEEVRRMEGLKKESVEPILEKEMNAQ